MKRLFIIVVLLIGRMSAQNIGARFDSIAQVSTGGSVRVIPFPTVVVCNHGSTVSNCGQNSATTYTDASLSTPCPPSTPVVLNQTNTCVSQGDANGNFGFWVSPQVTLDYMVSGAGATAQIYAFTTGGSATGAVVVQPPTCSVNPISLDFGSVQTGTTSATKTVAVTNTSASTPISVNGLTIFPTTPFFSPTPNVCNGVTAAQASCSIPLACNPSSLGFQTAVATVATTCSGTPLTVTLSCTGTAAATYNLSIVGSGTGGSGSVQSSDAVTCAPNDSTCVPVPPTISCSVLLGVSSTNTDCGSNYPSGTVVTLTGAASGSDIFNGFTIAGTPCANPCNVTMSASTTVVATFTAATINFLLSIGGTDQGIGTVTDDSGAINCVYTSGVTSGTCGASFPQGTIVNLTATPSASCTGGACTWKSWTGVSCATASCPVTMTGNTSVSADFSQPAGGNPVTFNQAISGGSSGGASLTFVKACNNYVAGAGTSTTVTCAIAAGDNACFFASEGSSHSATFTVSDSAGVTWTQTSSGYANNGGSPAVRHGLFCLANSATALSSVTVNWSTSVSLSMGIVLEFSGGATSGFEDSSVNSDSNSVAVVTLTSGALTTANANDVLIFCDRTDGDSGGFTVGAGYTLDANAKASTRGMCQYNIVAATQAGVTTSSTWVSAKSAGSIFGGFKASGASTTVTGTWLQAQKLGDLNVCLISWNDATTTVSTIADTSGNTYTQAVASPQAATGLTEAMYYAPNILAAGAGANAVTVTLNASPSTKTLNCAEYSGPIASPYDTSAGATGTSTAPASGNVTTASVNELLVGGVDAATTISAPASSYTQRVNGGTNDLEDRSSSTAGVYGFTPTLSSSGHWASLVAAFKTNGTTPTFAVTIVGNPSAGHGTGTITGDGGISCTIASGIASGVCSISVASGSTIRINALPANGSSFVGYVGGGCSTNAFCQTSAITTTTIISASFALPVSGGPFDILHQQSVLNRPYAGAYYNQKLPSAGSGGPTGHLMTNSDTMMTAIMQSGAATDAGAWNSPGSDDGQHKPLYYGQASDPVYQLAGCVSPESALNGIKFHAPSGAQFNQGSFDKEIIFWDQTTNQTVGLYGGTCTASNCFALPACSGTISAPCSFTVNGGYCSADNWVSGSGVGGGDAISTAGISPFGNIIRLTEVATIHHINHGLRLVDWCSGTDSGLYSSRTVFPSNQTGGTGANPCTATGTAEPRPPNGSLIFADYTQAQLDCFDPTKGACGGVTKLTSTQFALVEALTLYGGTTEDTGGGESIRTPGIESEQAYYFYDSKGYAGSLAVAQNFESYMNSQCSSPWCTVTPRSSPHSVYQWNLTWAGISSQGGKAFWQHLHIADPCVAISMQGLANDGKGTNACP